MVLNRKHRLVDLPRVEHCAPHAGPQFQRAGTSTTVEMGCTAYKIRGVDDEASKAVSLADSHVLVAPSSRGSKEEQRGHTVVDERPMGWLSPKMAPV